MTEQKRAERKLQKLDHYMRFRLPKSKLDQFEIACFEKGQTMSQVLRSAVDRYLCPTG